MYYLKYRNKLGLFNLAFASRAVRDQAAAQYLIAGSSVCLYTR